MKTLFAKLSLFITVIAVLTACSHKPGMPPLATFTPSLAVTKQWQVHVGNGTGKKYVWLAPAYDNGMVFVASRNGQVAAIDSASGKTRWRTNTRSLIASGIEAEAGKLYIGTSSGYLLAMNEANGAVLWKGPVTSEILATPSAGNNVVLANSEDGQLYAFAADSGKPLWSYRQQTPDLVLRSGNAVAAYENMAVAGFANGNMAVLNLQNGSVIWEEQIGVPQGTDEVARMVDIDADLAVTNGMIYVATFQGQIAAVSVHTGQIYWHQNLSSYAGLITAGSTIYATDADGGVTAFDRGTGHVVWKQSNLSERMLTGPALIGNAIAVGDAQGYLHFLSSADGHFIARVKTDPKGIFAQPLAAGNAIYVYTNSGRLIKYVVG